MRGAVGDGRRVPSRAARPPALTSYRPCKVEPARLIVRQDSGSPAWQAPAEGSRARPRCCRRTGGTPGQKHTQLVGVTHGTRQPSSLIVTCIAGMVRTSDQRVELDTHDRCEPDPAEIAQRIIDHVKHGALLQKIGIDNGGCRDVREAELQFRTLVFGGIGYSPVSGIGAAPRTQGWLRATEWQRCGLGGSGTHIGTRVYAIPPGRLAG